MRGVDDTAARWSDPLITCHFQKTSQRPHNTAMPGTRGNVLPDPASRRLVWLAPTAFRELETVETEVAPYAAEVGEQTDIAGSPGNALISAPVQVGGATFHAVSVIANHSPLPPQRHPGNYPVVYLSLQYRAMIDYLSTGS